MSKKILALVLAVIMMLALSTAALAADDPEGSITITNAVEGKTYDIFRMFDLEAVDTDGTAGYDAYSYTLNSNWVDFFIGDDADGAAYLVTTKPEGNTHPLSYNGTTYYINITNDNIVGLATAALPYAMNLTADESQTATADGDLEFAPIELGYYLIYPKGASEIADGFSSICSLTTAEPDAEISQKAEYPGIVKTDDKASVDLGELVTYTVTGEVPDTTAYDTYFYQITDGMTKGLTFNEDCVIKIGNTDVTDDILVITDATTADEIAAADATLKYIERVEPDEGAGTEEVKAGYELYFDMTKWQDYVGETITVTYTAVTNEFAVCNKTFNYAELEYSNDPRDDDDHEKTPPEIEHVWTSKIVIDKYDSETETKKLSGAKFVLMNSEGKFYQLGVDAKGNDLASWVDVSGVSIDSTAESTVSAADIAALKAAANITVVETDADGAAEFKGLKDGTYYLVEIESPDGYNLLDKTKSVAVAGAVPEGATDGIEVGVSVTAKVPNSTGTILPSTGGIGTTIFYAVGGLLVLGAFILLITKRRMNAKG